MINEIHIWSTEFKNIKTGEKSFGYRILTFEDRFYLDGLRKIDSSNVIGHILDTIKNQHLMGSYCIWAAFKAALDDEYDRSIFIDDIKIERKIYEPILRAYFPFWQGPVEPCSDCLFLERFLDSVTLNGKIHEYELDLYYCKKIDKFFAKVGDADYGKDFHQHNAIFDGPAIERAKELFNYYH